MPCNAQLQSQLESLAIMEALFDDLEDVVFFIKDEQRRYVLVNQTLVTRCGLVRKRDVIGKTTADVYPAPYGELYLKQDRDVLESGKAIKDKLELQLYAHGAQGWCLTNKVPIRGSDGSIVGMTGLSRDLHIPKDDANWLPGVSKVVDYIRSHPSERLRVDTLAQMASLSAYQLEQRMKRIFHVTIGQFIRHTRIDAARTLLKESPLPIADIAMRTGFYDQSAFARQFKASTGLTPREFRTLQQ
jgi:PAS domain S-box-containing protein